MQRLCAHQGSRTTAIAVAPCVAAQTRKNAFRSSSSRPSPDQLTLNRQRRQQHFNAAVLTRSFRACAAADVSDSQQSTAPSEEFWIGFAKALAKVAYDVKCEDIVLLDVQPVVNWTSYMIICTVFSRPQLLAVLAKVEKVAEDEFQLVKQNSLGTSPWELLDFGSVVVHVFTPEQRQFYDLESFYGDAEQLELPFVQGSENASSMDWRTKA